MKYVRTKNSIREIIDDYGNCCSVKSNHKKTIDGFTIIYGLSFAPRADNIEHLCDCFVGIYKDEEEIEDKEISYFLSNLADMKCFKEIYGAIWTDKGLIYVAKVNDKGELELL